MMDTNLLKYIAFVKAVELGSLTRAANALNYSQSGISRMIGDLEKSWGVDLLERGKNGIRLTSDGERILPGVKRLCDEYRDLGMLIDDLHDVHTGMIRIGTFSSVATHWLPNIIRAFQKDYPGIDYELLLGDYTEIETWISEGRVDCGFLRLPTQPHFHTIPLHRDRLLAILPPDHPLAALEKVPLQALCEEPFMLLERGARAEISELFERHGLVPQVHFTTWDDYAIMSMVEKGLGLSILPELILKRIPYQIVAKELDVPAFRDIALCLRSIDILSVATKKFLDYLDQR